MIEMTKLVLQKVSFDKHLFRKELLKAVKWLSKDEKLMLKVWCVANFGVMYRPIINQVFKNII
ncbi:MAG: hypothetical protein IT239_04515 [Bacteroidia bacterium]|nr:hypothetical protein [Bacteroidia bacterium]